jgi:hypothetical protein
MCGAISQGETLDAWDPFPMLGQEEMIPYLGQFFPAADLIDALSDYRGEFLV